MSPQRAPERGAVAIFAAFAMAVMLVAAALAVDLGMQRVARSDAQSLADVVALDLAQELNEGQTLAQLTTGGKDQTLANQSRDRNDSVIGTHDGHVPTLEVVWGEMVDGSFHAYRRPADDALIPTAVRVVAHTETGFPIMTTRTGKAQRRAVASADKGACFRIGSFVAKVRSGDSTLLNPILNGLLGSNLDVGLVGYDGIANANVSLLDLVETGNLGVGTVNELLKADDVNVADLIQASIDVLSSPGHGASAATITALQAIRAAVALSAPTIKIADLIEAAPSDPSALASSVNVLDLVMGSVLIATKGHAVAIPGLTVGPVAGITLTTTLSVIEGPRKACTNSGNFAETSQIVLTTRVQSPERTLPVTIAGLTGIVAKVDAIDLSVVTKLAHADATLLSVDGCDTGGPQGATLQVNSAAVPAPSISGAIHASVTATLDVSKSTTLLTNLLGGLPGVLSPLVSLVGVLVGTDVLGAATLKVDLTATPKLASATGVTASTQTVTVPASYWSDPAHPKAYPVPGTLIPQIGALSLATTVSVGGSYDYRKTGLLGLLTGPVLHGVLTASSALTSQLTTALTTQISDVLKSSLNTLTASLQATVIKTLSEMLGLNLGGADLWVEHEPRCGAPRLVE
ncbi:pilus assembly protein TadG-related protein [Nocardioides nitrophenolicus]|uniref:pilus assembly protein TadG-related protein n=1 Tax=Nocardioides nitrophenolicus TaxID=60489 RepID=UPI00195DCA40|nr:pilus assembly protein TadG-related protein [Nocardioides nitrophenolicus]MBM7519578.1 putative membrane protein [Nocardioides nitrophenolicus]